jgi:hypothetical protein
MSTHGTFVKTWYIVCGREIESSPQVVGWKDKPQGMRSSSIQREADDRILCSTEALALRSYDSTSYFAYHTVASQLLQDLRVHFPFSKF